MENSVSMGELNLKDTELRLGLPGSDEPEKRCSVGSKRKCSPEETSREEELTGKSSSDAKSDQNESDHGPPAKAQVVGWPPVRSFRKNSMQQKKEEESGRYVKVSMAGAPYLRKIDIKVFKSYPQVLKALEKMFECTFGEYSEREGYNGSEYVPTYEDKDGDWMLVGDVPWEMFTCSCKRLRIIKGSEAKGLGCL
ncbi:auxin-induced protein 22D-like [Neltuma alba]|uniref:auxin-induced protein 22D-like n=1 Tax=Neltuma alba TaxID=207710 RepID=UPI0010A41B7A|nr:auxin-induced protein 22D-like [Prosopis alba]